MVGLGMAWFAPARLGSVGSGDGLAWKGSNIEPWEATRLLILIRRVL